MLGTRKMDMVPHLLCEETGLGTNEIVKARLTMKVQREGVVCGGEENSLYNICKARVCLGG